MLILNFHFENFSPSLENKSNQESDCRNTILLFVLFVADFLQAQDFSIYQLFDAVSFFQVLRTRNFNAIFKHLVLYYS